MPKMKIVPAVVRQSCILALLTMVAWSVIPSKSDASTSACQPVRPPASTFDSQAILWRITVCPSPRLSPGHRTVAPGFVLPKTFPRLLNLRNLLEP